MAKSAPSPAAAAPVKKEPTPLDHLAAIEHLVSHNLSMPKSEWLKLDQSFAVIREAIVAK